MYCNKCGEYINNNSEKCSHCGNTELHNLGKNLLVFLIYLTILLMAVTIALGGTAVSEARHNIDEAAKSMPVPTTAVSPTQIPRTTPKPTATATPMPGIKNGTEEYIKSADEISFKTYYNSDFAFSCPYPNYFIMYDDYGIEYLYTLRSPDGTAIEKISAKRRTNEDIMSEYNKCVNSHSGTVDYKNIDSNYFAVSIEGTSEDFYKYCEFKNGNIYWFEFITPASRRGMYNKYIEKIYTDFNVFN